MSARRVIIVRHGTTPWSRKGRHTGRTDVGLDEDGCRDAVRTGSAVRPLASSRPEVRTSPLARARTTAELLELPVQPVVDDRLVEWDYGELEGLTAQEIRRRLGPDWDVLGGPVPGGETAADVEARVRGLVGSLGSGTTVLVSHGHVSRVLASVLLTGAIDLTESLYLAAGGFGVLDHVEGRWRVSGWNVGSTPASPPAFA